MGKSYLLVNDVTLLTAANPSTGLEFLLPDMRYGKAGRIKSGLDTNRCTSTNYNFLRVKHEIKKIRDETLNITKISVIHSFTLPLSHFAR